MGANKTHREKARLELHMNVTSYFEEILKGSPYKTTAVQPFISHLKKHPTKTYKTSGTLLEKPGRSHKWRSSMEPYIGTCQCWPISNNLFTLTLCGHRMWFGGLAGSDGWYGLMGRDSESKREIEIERERERETGWNSCCQTALMMMILYIKIKNKWKRIHKL